MTNIDVQNTTPKH